MTDAPALSPLASAALATPDPVERAAAENLASMQRSGAASRLLTDDPAYRAAFDRARDPNLSAGGRDAVVREMEAITIKHAAQQQQLVNDDMPEGLNGDEPIGAYLAINPELHGQIRDPAGLHDTALAAQQAGVPAGLFKAMVQDAAGKTHMLTDDAAHERGVEDARVTIWRMEGDNARQILVDATAWLNALANARPSLEDAVALAMTNPLMLKSAALLWRSGSRPRGSGRR
jgi:hypothetical protein